MFSSLDLKSRDPEFKSRSDHWLGFLQLASGSTPRLRMPIANLSVYCQLGLLICSVHLVSLGRVIMSTIESSVVVDTLIK